MNKVIAKIEIYNISTSTIYVSRLPIGYKSSQIRVCEPDEDTDPLLEQGFIWYQDFIAFDMLTDYLSYWIKIAVKDRLEIDPVIANGESGQASIILLPFQITNEERVWVFGDDEVSATFSFILPAGHYQLLFENREFTREEIEAEPNFECEDMDYDDWKDKLEFCLLTFIPTNKIIEPEILVYKGAIGREEPPTPLILYERKLYPNSND